MGRYEEKRMNVTNLTLTEVELQKLFATANADAAMLLLPTPVFLDFPCGSAGKESVCNAGHLGLIPGLRRSSGEGKV